MSQSTDAVELVALPASLPELLALLHQVIEEQNPRVLLIDRDQGSMMVVGRSTAYAPEFNEISLAFLLSQVAITFVDIDTQPADTRLVEHARVAQLQPVRLCAHPDDADSVNTSLEVLWTPTVSQGSLLLSCKAPSTELGWSLLATDLSRNTSSTST